MHERTQRKFCRTAFVLCCLVPTLLTVGWTLHFHRPWHEQDWQQALESALHVRITMDEVTAPRPQKRILHAVKIADLQAKNPLIEIDEISISGTVSITARRLSLHVEQLTQIARIANVWLADETFQPSHWQVDRLTLLGAAGVCCELEDLRCETKVSTPGTRQCIFQGKFAGDSVRLLVELSPAGKVKATLDAQQASMPGWLFAHVLPGAERWQSATVTGVLELVQQNSTVVGGFRGQIKSIDTKSWIGNSQLQTFADLRFDTLSWSDSRVDRIEGSLTTEKGQIANALLLSLKDKLRCLMPVEPTGEAAELYQAFDQIGCRFELNQEGLTVSGSFPQENNQWAMAISDGRPLVMQPAFSRLPLAFFIEAVCASSGFSIPATREAANLAGKLPLPAADARKK